MFSTQESLALSEAVNQVIPIYVENGAYLNSKLSCLPNGIIDKTYTGIGGTSLELDCERDSIVVVPYNNIADAKASKLSVSRKYLTHKYKKAYNDRPNRRLEKYLLSTKRIGQYIKIICVNDQLVNLKQELNAAGKSFEDFFILFDEIDSMQEQSAFRSVMDNCMDVYLAHPPEFRAMITATLRGFTHPQLQNEPRYKVVSEGRPKDKIDVIVTNSGKEELLLQIMAKVALDDKKVVVACNHIRTALDIIRTLEKKSPKTTLGLMCSVGSKKAAGDYYRTLNEEGNLPCKVNIITAAYFNGCDIKERYHNITYSSIKIASLQLSPSTIYQISGRGRNGLESNMLIVHEGIRNDDYVFYSKEELISLAYQNAQFRNGLKVMVSNLSDQLALEMAKSIHGILVEGFKRFPAVFRKIDDLTTEISYFKIDQRIIEQDACFLLENVPGYIDALKNIFQVNKLEVLFVDQLLEFEGLDKKGSLIRIVNELTNELSSSGFQLSIDDLHRFINGYRGLGLKELDTIIRSFEVAIKLSWDLKRLLEQITECIHAPLILSQLKKLYCRLLWCSFNDSQKLQRVILKDFKIGQSYTLKVLKQKERESSERIDTHRSFSKVDYHDFRSLLLANPSLIRNVIFQSVVKKNRANGKHERSIVLTGFSQQLNPFL